jgi:hypothetical protein
VIDHRRREELRRHRKQNRVADTKSRCKKRDAENVESDDDAAGELRGWAIAVKAQGGVRYSRLVGGAWLLLAKISRARNDSLAARDAAQTAVAELFNTVDENHPLLLEAQQLAR